LQQCSRGNLISRIKIQGLSFPESRTRFKTQDSRIKRRINQDKYEKVFSKTKYHMDFSQNLFTKEFLLSGNRLLDYCNRLPVAKWFSKSFQLNLQHSN